MANKYLTPQQFIDRVFEKGCLPEPKKYGYGYKLSSHLIVGVDSLASPDTGMVALFPPAISLYEKTRKIYGSPIPVTSVFRTHRFELDLQRRGYKTAAFVSPHCLACALDEDARPQRNKSGKVILTEKQVNREIRQATYEAAEALGFPKPRVGHRAYNEKFNHVDLKFMLFAPFTELPHPAEWKDLDPKIRKLYDRIVRPGHSW